MIIHRDDVQAVWTFKKLKSYCESKPTCDSCVFQKECVFNCNKMSTVNEAEKAACDMLVSGELGEDLKEGDNK